MKKITTKEEIAANIIRHMVQDMFDNLAHSGKMNLNRFEKDVLQLLKHGVLVKEVKTRKNPIAYVNYD